MLVQFSLKNFMSFKDEAVLDMTAIKAYKEHECNVIDFADATDERFLKVAAIYGANASGKSNFLLGMYCFKRIIAESLNNTDEDQGAVLEKYYSPYSFCDLQEASEFQVVKILGDCEFTYGFEYNGQSILSEWLYKRNLKNKRISILLERKDSNITIGHSVRRECERFKDQIPQETLALSFFNKLKLKTMVFHEVYNNISDMLVGPSDVYEDAQVLISMLPKEIDRNKNRLLEFLTAIDIGIRDINYKTEEGKVSIYTTHFGENNQAYHLDLFQESDGTRKAILIFMLCERAIRDNKIMLVDELNLKLHPLLLKFIIDLFNSQKTAGQLVYTTHDTTLLDKKFFRRDQIWFVEKDKWGVSTLTALAEYRIRSDASFEKDYLAGVYGGIPLIKEFKTE